MLVLGPQEELGAQISCVRMSRPIFSFLMKIFISLPPIPPSKWLNIYPFLANQRVKRIFSDWFFKTLVLGPQEVLRAWISRGKVSETFWEPLASVCRLYPYQIPWIYTHIRRTNVSVRHFQINIFQMSVLELVYTWVIWGEGYDQNHPNMPHVHYDAVFNLIYAEKAREMILELSSILREKFFRFRG